MAININRISLQNVTFAGVGMDAVVLDIDDDYSDGQISINGANVTNLQLAQAIFAAIEGGVYAAGIRIQRRNAQGLFPTTTLTSGAEKLVVTNRNSSSVVATEVQGYITIDGTERGLCSTYDVRGLGNYVYSPLTFWRVNGDNNRFLYYAGVLTPPKYYISASEELGLAESGAFPSVYQAGVNMEYRSSNASSNAKMYFIGETHIESKPYPGQDTDPYAPGGDSGTGGGTGTFDGTGDDIDIPGLPSLSAVDTGFITLFNPSAGQLKSLANYMWSNGFDLDTFKKIFADPMDCILGLSIVPVAVPNGGTAAVSVGNISTGVSMTKAAAQYVAVDCGTLNVEEYWGAYLDYDPFTKAEIYLPYIGTHPLAVDDIMGKAVHVVYHVDILSGACTAFVKCGGSVLYEFIGQCSSSIPVTGNDWTNVINGVLSIAGAVGTMVATGGASAPLAAGMIASTAVNSMKPNVEKSGSMSGTGGMLAVQTPYLILTRPNQARPARQNAFTGYPSFITSNLGSLSGFTIVEEIHLENISGTEQELSEIESLLKSGVLL